MKKLFSILFIISISTAVILSCASAENADHSAASENSDTSEPVSPPDVSSPDTAVTGGAKMRIPEPVTDGGKDMAEGIAPGDYGIRAEDAKTELEPFYEDDGDYSYKSFEPADAAAPSQSGLKAGYSDDNRQYGYFLSFLDEYGQQVEPLDLNVAERIILKVTDRNGKSINGASIKLESGGRRTEGITLADGTYQINPSALGEDKALSVEINAGSAYPGITGRLEINRAGARNIEFPLNIERIIPEPIPLDIVFVMDTTGSMGEEIQRLKETIRIIHMNLGSLSIPAEVRFGMVLYKDQGDEYDTMTIPLTADIDLFQSELDLVQAFGGGDTPEDLELALDVLINDIDWNLAGIKLAYIITDAPPHLDYGRTYTCASAARDARALGLKIYGIGTGGLNLQGEYILRQIAQYTSARYIFLTYGSESGESAGGEAGSVSHHTGANWNADKLESIIIRFAKEELSHLSDSPLLDVDDWLEADRIDTEEVEETLANLFDQALSQLLDFSTWPVNLLTPLAVLPFQFEGELAADAEYFAEHFILSAGSNEKITLAERKDISQLLSEIELQNLGITEEGKVSEIGELLNAEVLVTGNLFIKDGKYELFLKMLRTETGEVLSVTRAVIAAGLGL